MSQHVRESPFPRPFLEYYGCVVRSVSKVGFTVSQSDVPVVSIVKCAAYDNVEEIAPFVRSACDLVGGLESVIMPGDTVLIKPNLVLPYAYQTGATTNPNLVEALAIQCREKGAKRIVIGDGSCVGSDTEQAFDACGYRAMAERIGAELVDFAKAESTYVVNPLAKKMKRIAIPNAFIEANVVIDIPVMKTHDSLEVSLGLKNMKGILQTRDKKRFHKWGLAQSIVDLNQIARPDLTVMDATVAMEGSGPASGDPVNLGLLLASKDVVAVDAVAIEVMGFGLDEVDYVALAAKSGIGCADLSQIEIEGEPIASVKRPFARTSIDPAVLADAGIELVACDACSGCANALSNFMGMLVKMGALEGMRDTVFLYGQSVEELPEERTAGKRVIRVGSCTRKLVGYGHYLPGCPPYPYHMMSDLGLE